MESNAYGISIFIDLYHYSAKSESFKYVKLSHEYISVHFDFSRESR